MSASLPQPPAPYVVNGIQFMSAKLDCFQQLHVLRKLGPVIAKIGPAFLLAKPTSVVQADGSVSTVPPDLFSDLSTMGPALEALSEMSEEDVNYVLYRCMAVTKRWQEPGVWVSVWSEAAKRLMFEDMDLMTMMHVVFHVLGESLSGFTLGDEPNLGVQSSPQNDQSNTSNLKTVRIS